jgi:ATP-dependent DNA helicase RecQ
LTMDYMKQEGEFHTLSLTVKALDALKKRETIFGVMQEAERVQKKGGKKAEVEYHSALFALLRQQRKAMADEAGVPPYVIFSDRTLTEMAAYLPQSSASLLNISGVGQVKLEKYGDAFLEVIKAYCEKHELKEKPRKSESPSPAGRRARDEGELPARTRIVGEAFNAGASVQDLMQRHGVTANTILDHLNKYLLAGNTIRSDNDLQSLTSTNPDQQQAVFDAFDELGPNFLKPVFDQLNGTLNYDDLKILRMLYLISHQDQ